MEEMHQEKCALEENWQIVDKSLKTLYAELCLLECDEERDKHMEKILCLKDEQINISDTIKEINDHYNLDRYFSNTASILFQYYDIIEKGGIQPPTNKEPAHEHSILKYFGNASPTQSSQSTSQSNVIVNQHQQAKEQSRGVLLDQYLRLTSPEYIDHLCIQSQNNVCDVCSYCKSTHIVTMVNDGYVLCNNCNNIEYIIIDHEKPSYRDPPKEISFYAYKRSNHLNEWLSQMQGKETTDIPEEVYDKILLEIKKQKITNMASITPKKIREILRKLQINKYEHIPHIINRLTGRPMLQMSPDLEEKLRNMFKQVQAPFLKHAPATRKNFLSYSYCLHKMLQLLGKDEYLNSCTLLKSKDKLVIQDQIWKKICQDLDWQFIPSC
jgi:hypothetical protein